MPSGTAQTQSVTGSGSGYQPAAARSNRRDVSPGFEQEPKGQVSRGWALAEAPAGHDSV
jgi:hypothetical protein